MDAPIELFLKPGLPGKHSGVYMRARCRRFDGKDFVRIATGLTNDTAALMLLRSNYSHARSASSCRTRSSLVYTRVARCRLIEPKFAGRQRLLFGLVSFSIRTPT